MRDGARVGAMTRTEVRMFLVVGDGTDLRKARVACAGYRRGDVTDRGGFRNYFLFLFDIRKKAKFSLNLFVIETRPFLYLY